MTKTAPAGTQSVLRSIQVMKAVAERKEIGWRLTDLASHCKLGKATTYRLVASLASQRLLQQRPADKRYVPGPLLFELALALPAHGRFKEVVHQELLRLSRQIRGIAFLYLLAGDEAVCIDRVGASAIPPLTGVGTRRLIAQSTFGISMLLAMPRSQQEAILKQNRQAAPALAQRNSGYRGILQQSRLHGFGLNQDIIVPGMTTIAVPLLKPDRSPFASLGIMAPTSEFTAARIASVAAVLKDHAARIVEEQNALIAEIGLDAPK
jgi:DNA-binding IclR family transcriptional regulator